MPIYKDKNLLFIHIPKNCGQSIEKALSGRGFKNKSFSRSFVNKVIHYLLIKTSPKDAKSNLNGTIDIALSGQHLTFNEIKTLELINPQILSNLISFAVVRNPYTRIISSISHFRSLILPRLGKKANDIIEDEDELYNAIVIFFNLNSECHNILAHKRCQHEYVLDLDGKIAVDYILNFENIENSFGKMCKEIGFSNYKLPKIGSNNYKYSTSLPKLNSAAQSLILEKYKYDFELFNFEKKY